VRGSFADGAKRSVFVVNSGEEKRKENGFSVALVAQQAHAIGTHTNLSIAEYSSMQRVDDWTKERWLHEFDEHQVQ